MFVKIKPLDTLFFRNGRPFTMGAETWSDYVFPPNPSTLYGAIRTNLIFENATLDEFLSGEIDGSLREVVGTKERKGRLKLLGPFLCKEETATFHLIFPTPADIVPVEENGIWKPERTLLLDVAEELFTVDGSDYPFRYGLFFKENKKVEDVKSYMSAADLVDYLHGKNVVGSLIPVGEVLKSEWKIGIKRNNFTKTSEEGYLYRIPMIRMNPEYSLVVEVDTGGNLNLPDRGVFKLGGESRVVFYEKLHEDPLDELRYINLNWSGDKLFKIYLATPAIFKNGWLPSWINRETLEGVYKYNKKEIELSLVAVALKKYKLIGGWDMASNKPKPMYRAVGEGSVYYFRVKNDVNMDYIKHVFHLKAISDVYPEEGYGLAFVGTV